MNDFITKYFYVIFFFTTWNILLVVFHKYTSEYIDLLYLSFITMFIGLYLSLVNPRKFVFRYDDKKYVFMGFQKFLMIDIVFHIFIFLYVFFYIHESFSEKKLLGSILILAVYIICINIKKVYGISIIEFIILFSIINILYFAVF